MFEQDVVYSIMLGAFRSLIHVTKLPNVINGNVQPVYPVISNIFSEKRPLAPNHQISLQRSEIIPLKVALT